MLCLDSALMEVETSRQINVTVWRVGRAQALFHPQAIPDTPVAWTTDTDTHTQSRKHHTDSSQSRTHTHTHTHTHTYTHLHSQSHKHSHTNTHTHIFSQCVVVYLQ